MVKHLNQTVAINRDPLHRSRWFVGRHLQTLIEANSSFGLPLRLNLEPASCNDADSGAIVLHHACRQYAQSSIRLRYGLFDKAYEGEPFLRLCYHHGLDPLVARTRPAKLKAAIKRRLAKAGVRISSDGVPVCQAALPLLSRGHSKPHVLAWSCPRGGDCENPCPFAHKSLCLNALDDPRALTPVPSATKPRKALFRRRTAVERWHAWLDYTEVQNARHRRDYLWFGRSALATIAWHLKHWAPKLTDQWLRDTFPLTI
ncbi:MAG TPA: transposase [Bacillota bacterium]|nr:transposase [Bacillota bacterium]